MEKKPKQKLHKEKEKKKAAADSPHYKQEGIRSFMPPQFKVTAEPVQHKKLKNEEDEKSVLQEKKANSRSFADSGDSGADAQGPPSAAGAAAPTQPNQGGGKPKGPFRPSEALMTKRAPVQQKAPFQLKNTPHYQKGEAASPVRPFQLKRTAQFKKNKPRVKPFELKNTVHHQEQEKKKQPEPYRFPAGSVSELPGEIMAKMEKAFGFDFSGVNIFKNSSMAKDLGALAFAQGSDVHFAPGQFNPMSSQGQELIGHEFAHVVQQSEGRVKPTVQAKGLPVNDDKGLEKEADEKGKKAAQTKVDGTEGKASPKTLRQNKTVQRSVIQKNETTETPTTEQSAGNETEELSNEFSDPTAGDINTSTRQISLPTLQVPEIKLPFGPAAGGSIPPGATERLGTQQTVWAAAAVETGTFVNTLTEYATERNAPDLSMGGERIYYMVKKANEQEVVFGSPSVLRRGTVQPNWNERGATMPYHVDHKLELQLGGADAIGNMWLLDATTNTSSGSAIKGEIERRITAVLSVAEGKLLDAPSDAGSVKSAYTINLPNGVSDGLANSGRGETWGLEEIQNGQHIRSGLRFLSHDEVRDRGLQGTPTELLFYTRETGGGTPIRVPWGENTTTKSGLDIFLGRSRGNVMIINSITYNPVEGQEQAFGGTGSVGASVFKDGVTIAEKQVTFSIAPVAGILHGGYIPRDSVRDAVNQGLNFTLLSPIRLDTAELDMESGLIARGQVLPSIALFRDANVDLIIDSEGIRVSRTFAGGDINLPSPFTVSNSSLEIFGGAEGIGFNGQIDFGVQNLGDGFLRAGASSATGFKLEGGFNFDTELFDRAEVTASYTKPLEGEGVWEVEGTLGISEGKIAGVQSAEITVNYSEGVITADGTAELDIPGVESASLNAVYANNEFTINGGFQLSSEVPGIRSGSGNVQFTRSAAGDYQIGLSGTAVPDIPGIDSNLTVEYSEGALTLEATAAYSRGMLSGQINVGVTNRAVDDTGEATGAPSDTFSVYGGGELTLKLTPWLEATAGVQFLPDGQIEVTGRIGLPSTVDLFDRKSFDKDIFTAPTIEIPIFAIPLGPRSIGIVAQITGGLGATAGIGPGELRDLSLEIQYNPDQEDQTTITGTGEFGIPADAGLKLTADLGIGASVAIASVTGGIQIEGGLGLEGEAKAAVNVNWRPDQGLELNAEGSITVSPKFTFDINAFIRGTIDLWIKSFSEEWTHNLAAFEWGPDMEFGIVFPVNYKEGEPFDLSVDDIEFNTPEISIRDIASGLATEVKDAMF